MPNGVDESGLALHCGRALCLTQYLVPVWVVPYYHKGLAHACGEQLDQYPKLARWLVNLMLTFIDLDSFLQSMAWQMSLF